jgi:hypothetical protein
MSDDPNRPSGTDSGHVDTTHAGRNRDEDRWTQGPEVPPAKSASHRVLPARNSGIWVSLRLMG